MALFGGKKNIHIATFDADNGPYTRKLNDAQQKTLKATNKIKRGWDRVGKSMMTVFSAAAVGQFLKTSIEAANKQELAQKKLEVALGRTSRRLLDQASAMQKLTTFGDEVIIDAMAIFAAFTKDEKAIEKLTKATLDLAVGLKMDLNGAAQLVAKTFGSSTNALSRYGIAIDGAVGSNERLENTVGGITDLFGGQASGERDTFEGSVTAVNNALGDLQEKVGQDLQRGLADTHDELLVIIEDLIKLNDILVERSGTGLIGNIGKAIMNLQLMLASGGALQNLQLAENIFGIGKDKVDMQNPRFWLGDTTTGTGNVPITSPTTTTTGGKRKITGKNAMILEAMSRQTGSGQISASGFLPGFNDLAMSGVEQPLFKPFPDDWQSEMASVRDYTLSMAAEVGYAMQSAFGGAGDTLISKLSTALQIAVNVSRSINNFNSEGGGGLGGILGIAASFIPGLGFLANFDKGGSVINYGGGNVSVTGIPHFATGGSMVVPPGFSGDNFPFMAKSGERIDITPMNRIPVAEKLLGEIKSSIQAMNANNIMSGSGKQSVSVNIDGKQLAEIVQARTNDLSKSKTALDQL